MTNHRTCKTCLTALLALSLAGLSGCSVFSGSAFHQKDVPPYQVITAPEDGSGQFPGVVEQRSVTITLKAEEPPPPDYVIGPNDVVHVNVFGKPELGTTVMVSPQRTLGSRVDGQGRIQLPMIGAIQVAGLTRTQVQEKLEEAYKKYIAQPWVVVEMVQFGSKPVYLVGEFASPGVYYMDRPTNVLQALTLAGGVKESGDLRSARLMRNNQVQPVDLYRLLREGAFDQNVWLRPQDTIYVPDSADQKVYVVGDVGQAGPVPLVHGRLNLLEALTRVGGPSRGGADWKQVRIIRSLSPTRGQLIVLDYQKMLDGGALPYPLMAGDIVYVARTKLGTWNDAMREILPTIRVLGATLQPIVQVLYIANGDQNN